MKRRGEVIVPERGGHHAEAPTRPLGGRSGRPTARALHAQLAGFTLIELMVALAVLAIALAAVIGALGAQARNLAHLRDRTLATIVAANAATLARLDQGPRERSFEVELAGRRWRVMRTDAPGVELFEVRGGGEAVLARCRLPRAPQGPAAP